MVFSLYKRQRILYYYFQGYRAPMIGKKLESEKLKASRRGISKFIKKYIETGNIGRHPGSGRATKLTAEIKEIIEEQMHRDNETIAYQLHQLLVGLGYCISLRTILRCRTSLDWTFCGSSYCQLIRHVNKEKRLEWACQKADDAFENVLFSDECMVQLESHRQFCCRKKGEPPKNKPRAKHPAKVHVWAGISKTGATSICIFEGKMNASVYVEILEQTLLPFTQDSPVDIRFMQDNDPKHTSCRAKAYFERKDINWWKTPTKSPDLNPIENLWHELKKYIQREVKPKVKEELVCGIEQFWSLVTVEKCNKYIGHLRKVVPKDIEVNGEATGY